VSLGTAFNPADDPNSFSATKIEVVGNETFVIKPAGISPAYPPSVIKFKLK